MLKRLKLKAFGLMIAVATPGFMTFSCSGKFQRELRDAAIDGASNFVTTRTFDALTEAFPGRANED